MPLGEAVELGRAKSYQERIFLVGIPAVDFHQAANEELLLFRGGSLPIIGLVNSNNEAAIPSPALPLSLFFSLRNQVHEILYGGKIIHFPGLAN